MDSFHMLSSDPNHLSKALSPNHHYSVDLKFKFPTPLLLGPHSNHSSGVPLSTEKIPSVFTHLKLCFYLFYLKEPQRNSIHWVIPCVPTTARTRTRTRTRPKPRLLELNSDLSYGVVGTQELRSSHLASQGVNQ